MLYIGLTFLSVVIYVVQNLLSKIYVGKSQNPRAYAFIYKLFTAIWAIILGVAISFILHWELKFPNFTIKSIILFWFLALLFRIYDSMFWRATKNLELSILGILNNLSLIVSIILSALLFHDRVTWTNIIGIILILISLFLVTTAKAEQPQHTSNQHINRKKEILLAITVFIVIGVIAPLSKIMAQWWSVNFYNIVGWIPSPILLLIPRFKKGEIKNELRSINILGIIFCAMLSVTGYFFFLWALKIGNTIKVVTIWQLIMPLTTIAAIVVLKEREHWIKKVISIVLAFIGSLLMI